MNTKISYTPPQVTEVRLIVKESVLANCHDSPTTTAIDAAPLGCLITAGYDPCWDGPGF